MNKHHSAAAALPGAEILRDAIRVYLDIAYPQGAPASAAEKIPSADASLRAWLMSDCVERDPPDAAFEEVRSFILRLGNAMYPHMKLRLSRPPRDSIYLFSVDAHDAFLHAEPGSPDHEALEELKRHNAEVAAAVMEAWNRTGLPTEHNYLRERLRRGRSGRTDPPPGPPVDEP